jgi:hypothetical protein
MKLNKIVAIKGKYGPLLFSGKGEYCVIRNFLIAISCLLNGENIMPKRSQSQRSRFGKLLISIEFCHELFLVLTGDRAIDLGALGFAIGPGVGQVCGGQAWVVFEEFGFAEAHA